MIHTIVFSHHTLAIPADIRFICDLVCRVTYASKRGHLRRHFLLECVSNDAAHARGKLSAKEHYHQRRPTGVVTWATA